MTNSELLYGNTSCLLSHLSYRLDDCSFPDFLSERKPVKMKRGPAGVFVRFSTYLFLNFAPW